MLSCSVRCSVNGLTGLAVTKLDVLDTFAEIPVGVGYTLDGETIDSMPAECRNHRTRAADLRRRSRWQKAAQRSAQIGRTCRRRARGMSTGYKTWQVAPVRYVSVGTRRDQIIEV